MADSPSTIGGSRVPAAAAEPQTGTAPGLLMRLMVGVGGIGSGLFFALEDNHTLGRNESRPGRLLDVRDYCKLHIISHYVAVLLRADAPKGRFRVLPVGKVGQDETGRRLAQEMAAAGMDVSLVRNVPGRPTMLSVCFQYPDGSGGNITTSESAAGALTEADVDEAVPVLCATGRQAIALVAPEAPMTVRRHLLRRATESGAVRVAAFASAELPEAAESAMLGMVDLLAMNQDEAGVLVGSALDLANPQPFLDRLAAACHRHQPAMRLLLSAGGAGAWAFDASRWSHCPALPVEVASTAGAGDALLGAAIAGLACGADLHAALPLAVSLAALTVTSPHTIHPGANLPAVLELAGKMGVAIDPLLVRQLG